MAKDRSLRPSPAPGVGGDDPAEKQRRWDEYEAQEMLLDLLKRTAWGLKTEPRA